VKLLGTKMSGSPHTSSCTVTVTLACAVHTPSLAVTVNVVVLFTTAEGAGLVGSLTASAGAQEYLPTSGGMAPSCTVVPGTTMGWSTCALTMLLLMADTCTCVWPLQVQPLGAVTVTP